MADRTEQDDVSIRDSLPPPGQPVDLPAQRVVLGEAMQRRAHEMGTEVVARWSERRSCDEELYERAASILARNCRVGTEVVGRYLATGESATQEETLELASTGEMTAANQFPWIDITKNCLTWHDVNRHMVLEEGVRLGIDPALIAEVLAVVSHHRNAGLVMIAKQFDVERRELHQRLEDERAKLAHLALHDPLTGLPNRALLLDRLAHAVALPAREERSVTVLFLDLDGFKAVNDGHGHMAGDTVLVAVAHCLLGLVRPADTVARLGGDEFVILCEDLGGPLDTTAMTERIRAGVAVCHSPQPGNALTVSIGIAVADAGADPERILAEADRAMYADKHVEGGSKTPISGHHDPR